MAITTVETVNIEYNGVTVDTYGLSDTLDTYTIDDIKNYVYCSCTNKTIRGFQEFVNDGEITMFNNIFPFSTTKLSTSGHFLFDVNSGSTLPIPDGAYVFTVWLKCSDTLELTSSNIGDAKLVTSMNAPRMKYTLPNPAGTKDNVTTWAGGDGSQCYATGSGKGSLAYVHNIDAHNTTDIGISDVHPYMLIVLDNVVFFWRFRMDTMKFLSRPQSHGTYGGKFVGGRAVTAYDTTTYSVLGTKIRTLSVGLPYDWATGSGSGTSSNPNSWGTADDNMIVYAEGGGNNNQIQFGCVRFYWYPNTRHEALLLWAGCGVKFYGDKLYKPIIENGYVTGYTDNMNEPSELDDWDGDTKHTVPSGPPSPPGPDNPGEWDDMPGAGSSIGALAGARCYICSKTDIVNLKSWMSKTEADGGPPDGYDVLSSLISVMAFPINMSPASSGPSTAITFAGLRTATDNQLMNIATALLSISNQVGATPITETKMFTSTATAFPSAGNPFTIDLGSITCPTFYSNNYPFVDYDASVELYLPFIGTMSLDTQTVMGNSLHAYMSVDPITGAIYSWCECSKDGSRVIVASGAGAIGVNTPITANQVGMAMAQIKANTAQTRQTALQSAITMGIGAFTGVDKNMSSILMKYITSGNKNLVLAGAKDYADALSVGAQQASMTAIPNAIGASLNSNRANRQIAQANHNSVSGSAGGSTADWACSYTPYLKIITPDVHDAGNQYEHTYGVPTVQSGTLSSFSGLTFCANPDVSSISTATDQEKQQIFGLLTGGVYV